MIAPGALVRHPFFFIEIAGAVGACLDAVTAADAVLVINQDRSVLGLERRAHRADLDASGMIAVIAYLGNEEGMS